MIKGAKTKVWPYNKPEQLEKMLNDGWVINGGFSHQNKAVLILQK